MTLTAPRKNDRSNLNDYMAGLLAERPPQSSCTPEWPALMRCDVINVPVDICCGVLAHLVRDGVALCPIAQIGDRMMFLTALGSTAACIDSTNDLPGDLTLRTAADSFPACANPTLPTGCWVIPPVDGDMILPSAGAVLSALRSAYIEYREAQQAKII